MSQSSMSEQIKELASAGLPIQIHKGTRTVHREPEAITPHTVGSDLWYSRWSHNAFRNYPITSKSFGIRFLAEAAHGVPAFVVGIGPSLDESIKELKQAKGRSLIISTDAALRALLANGIEPDLVISYDCKDDQNRLWQGVTQPIPALFNSCAHPNSIQSWPGPILFYNQYHGADELCSRILPDVLPNLGQIPSGGTVGTMAALAAHAMGCDPICAVGMDFCFKQVGDKWRYRAQDYAWVAGSNRAAGLPDGWEPTEIKELYDNDERVERSFAAKGDEGKEFKSDPELTFYLESFVDILPHFKVPLVNCSPDGMIPAKLFPVMTVDQAVSLYCKSELQGGRSVIKYLSRIAPNPRRDLVNA